MEIKLTESMPIVLYAENVDVMSPEEFTQIRRAGFGGSDSSVLCGVNPYSTVEELIQSKIRTEPSPEELAIGQNRNVRAGRDLEPLILEKINKSFPEWRIIKPSHMYKFKNFEYLTMNFDGVAFADDLKHGLFPVEIKLVTIYGGKGYDLTKALFRESTGFQLYPPDIANTSMPIATKASHYGIPAYYYTQVQQEMAALDAKYGFLAALFEKDWELCVFRIPFDETTWSQIIVNGHRVWEDVKRLKDSKDVNSMTPSEISVDPDVAEIQLERY